MKVICVDDEKYVLQDLMNKCGEIEAISEVKGFRHGSEAVEYLKSNSVQIVFLDIDMPDINGLELAKQIKDLNPKTDIIFTTGYSKFAMEAFKVHASGYLLKPVGKENLQEEIDHILAKQPEIQEEAPIETCPVFAQCFGNFELFVNGTPVQFARKKCKELMAYLIDRHGAAVTRKEMASILFEDSDYDRNVQSYLTKIISDMISSLEASGLSNLIIKLNDTYAADITKIRCDAWDFMAGKNRDKYFGEYMKQYYWAEEQIGRFEK